MNRKIRIDLVAIIVVLLGVGLYCFYPTPKQESKPTIFAGVITLQVGMEPPFEALNSWTITFYVPVSGYGGSSRWIPYSNTGLQPVATVREPFGNLTFEMRKENSNTIYVIVEYKKNAAYWFARPRLGGLTLGTAFIDPPSAREKSAGSISLAERTTVLLPLTEQQTTTNSAYEIWLQPNKEAIELGRVTAQFSFEAFYAQPVRALKLQYLNYSFSSKAYAPRLERYEFAITGWTLPPTFLRYSEIKIERVEVLVEGIDYVGVHVTDFILRSSGGERLYFPTAIEEKWNVINGVNYTWTRYTMYYAYGEHGARDRLESLWRFDYMYPQLTIRAYIDPGNYKMHLRVTCVDPTEAVTLGASVQITAIKPS